MFYNNACDLTWFTQHVVLQVHLQLLLLLFLRGLFHFLFFFVSLVFFQRFRCLFDLFLLSCGVLLGCFIFNLFFTRGFSFCLFFHHGLVFLFFLFFKWLFFHFIR